MAFGRETNTDCLFTPRSLRTVTVANKRESQRLVARLRSLNDEMHLKMTHMNFCAKKTKEKLVKIKQEISEKIDPEPEEPTPSSKDQDDYHNAHLDYLLHEDNEPVPSIKQLISYAMEQFELEKEESKKAAAQEDFLNQDSTKDEQLNQSVEPVAHTEETDQTQSDRINEVICEDNALVDPEDNTLADPHDNALADPQDNALADPEIMTVQELKALIVHMCGPEESELNLDSVTECLLPILRKTEVKTSEPQLGKRKEQLILLKQILSTEFPETYVRQEKGKRDYFQSLIYLLDHQSL